MLVRFCPSHLVFSFQCFLFFSNSSYLPSPSQYFVVLHFTCRCTSACRCCLSPLRVSSASPQHIRREGGPRMFGAAAHSQLHHSRRTCARFQPPCSTLSAATPPGFNAIVLQTYLRPLSRQAAAKQASGGEKQDGGAACIAARPRDSARRSTATALLAAAQLLPPLFRTAARRCHPPRHTYACLRTPATAFPLIQLRSLLHACCPLRARLQPSCCLNSASLSLLESALPQHN
jgi:hypothetical protein